MPTEFLRESIVGGHKMVADSLRECGVEVFHLDEAIVERLVELEETYFNEDSRAVRSLVLATAAYLVEEEPGLGLSEEQMKTLGLAATLHDVGKSGPPDADLEMRSTIRRIYSLGSAVVRQAQEASIPPDSTIEHVVQQYWPGAATRMLMRLAEIKDFSLVTMRDFWNAHGYWSYELLATHPKGLNQHVIDIVAFHHVLEGISPKPIAPDEYFVTGSAEKRMAFMLIAADKYEAARVRGGKDHETAMNVVRGKVIGSQWKDNAVFLRILDAFNKVGEKTLAEFLKKNQTSL